MENSAPQFRPDAPSLLVLQQLIATGPPEAGAIPELLAGLAQEQHLEHALTVLRQARPDPERWSGFLAALKEAVARSRVRRMSLWQVDPRRRTLRLCFAVRPPVCGLHPPALLAVLARLLMDAGLPLAMGLEKHPRPAVQLGHPLPLGASGLCEWADAVLREGPGMAPEALTARLNAHAPEGLRVLKGLIVPNHASKVSDLCRVGRWQWPCPEELLEAARERVAAFLASAVFEIDKPGKVDGHKAAKRLDLKPLLAGLTWDGAVLSFQTRIAPGEAANPRKLLAPLLGLETEAIQGLVRTEVELAEDPRLLQEDRFAPKLHNMFEDAVLLESGSNIRIIDEDDDPPLRIG